MAEVKWIKLQTDIFDDEKILLIESLPDAYAIITVWFKLLCLAGKQNNDGVFMMSNRLAYTDKMLATVFRMNEATVTLALKTFEQFGMIEIVEGVITIPNWGKHQTLDSYEKKKERDKLYQAERRAAQKAKIEKSSDNRLTNRLTSNDTSADASSDIVISDIDIEEDKEKDIDNNDILSDSASSSPSPSPSKSKSIKHKYGEYNNVLLTDEELAKLKNEFTDWAERVERLSSYIASTGKSYKSHYVTIRNWAKRDAEKPQVQIKPTRFNNFSGRSANERTAYERMQMKKQVESVELSDEYKQRVAKLKEELGQ
jgi:predicted phage replisome organizer